MRLIAIAAAFALLAGAAQARDWDAEARRTAIGLLPTVAQSAPGAAVLHASYCVAVEAIVANRRGRELTPWGMLECVPVGGAALSKLYRLKLPQICALGPDAFPYHHSRQSVYIIDRTREWYSVRAYRMICGRRWTGRVTRQQEDDY